MKYVIGSLVGAVIGYITNWLAIKMLFRPHKEIRIGNFIVPFTPGLIPKEKPRLARSIGATIGQHLLTKETIIDSLCSETMNEQLEFWIKNKISHTENSDATIECKIKSLLGDRYSDSIKHFNIRVSELIVGYVNQESIKKAMAKFVTEQMIQGLSLKPQIITQSGLYKSLKDRMLDTIIQYKDSENFYIKIKKLLEEKAFKLKNLEGSFEDIVPDAVIKAMKEYVYSRRGDIALSIKGLMKKENVRRKLRQIVEEAVGTLNPMIAMFVSPDKIYEKALIGIHEYLDDEKNHDDIVLAVNDIIDRMLKSRISDIVSRLSDEGMDNTMKYLINILRDKIFHEKYIKDTYNRIEVIFNEHASIEELLEKTGIDYREAIGKFVETRIEEIAGSESFKSKILEAVDAVTGRLLALEMKSIFKEAEKKITPQVCKMARDLYNKFIEKNAAGVIEVLNVAGIVEDKINEFDVEYTESLILEVASKELKAITWLGGLLGAVMGLLSPFINSLY